MASLNRPIWVSDQTALQSMLKQLRDRPSIAIDTESNSLYAYQERVCLIQISIPGADFLIDPFPPALNWQALGEIFADAKIEKLFHACEYDVIGLHRDLGFEFANVFDTMWAARVLGWPRVGLADILQTHFNVALNKRWQRFNWGKRPLPMDALLYARLDTHYLHPLRDLQLNELQAKGRLEEAHEIFSEVTLGALDTREENNRRDGFWRVKGVFDLPPVARAVLRELYEYREAEARRIDLPPFKVLNEQALLEIANTRPTRIDHLQSIKGLSNAKISRYGSRLLQAVQRGKQAAPPKAPPRSWIDPQVLERYERLREWRKQIARQRGVESDVIIGNSALMAIARRNARSVDDLQDISGLGAWRLKTYGAAIMDVLGEG
jgi:ribonuclease D